MGSFADTKAGLEEAKLRHLWCKVYANAIKKGTDTLITGMEEIPQDVRKRMDDKMSH